MKRDRSNHKKKPKEPPATRKSAPRFVQTDGGPLDLEKGSTLHLHRVTQVGRPGTSEANPDEDTNVDKKPTKTSAPTELLPDLPDSLRELSDDEFGLPYAPADEMNLLRINAGIFSLELEGDAEFINNIYDSVRDELLAKMRSALRERQEQQRIVELDEDDLEFEEGEETGPLNLDPEKLARIRVKGNGYVWVYVCHELYNKVHVVSRDTLAVSPLASVVNTKRMNKVYVNRARLPQLEALIGSGKTLWSELTTEGRRRLRRGGL